VITRSSWSFVLPHKVSRRNRPQYANGAAPEIVEHGRTGFLCRDIWDMADALDRVDTIDRRTCRVTAQRRFDRLRMARDHEQLYRRILTGERRSRAAVPTPVVWPAPT
jgi:hypothetical protein